MQFYRAAERLDLILAAPPGWIVPVVVYADHDRPGRRHDAQPIGPARGTEWDDSVVPKVIGALPLIQIALALGHVHPLVEGVAQVKVASGQHGGSGGRRDNADLGDVQREGGRSRLVAGRVY